MYSHLPDHFKGRRKTHRATGENITSARTHGGGGGYHWCLGEKALKMLVLKYVWGYLKN